MQEDNQRTTKAKPQKIGEEEKRRQRERKTDKRKANTPQASNPPNSTRAQKPHKPRKAPRQHKPTPNPQNPLKTPLKREIEPYSNVMHHKQSGKADKKQGAHDQRTTANRW